MPRALPALMRAAKLQKRAARYGEDASPEAQRVADYARDLQCATGPQAAEEAAGKTLVCRCCFGAAGGHRSGTGAAEAQRRL